MNSPSPEAPSRVQNLDFAKGAMVLLMVIYHWGVLFFGQSPYLYNILRFLTPSFIFIAGAVMALISLPRRGLEDRAANTRMVLRGLKLALFFTALNLGIQALFPVRGRSYLSGLPVFTEDLYEIFVTGNSMTAAFRVLLPIAYLMIVAYPVLWLFTKKPKAGIGFLIALCAGIEVGEAFGYISANLTLLSFGIFGLSMCYFGIDRVNNLAKRTLLLVGAYVIYLAVLMYFGPFYWVQLLGVPLSLLVLYAGRWAFSEGRPLRTVLLLGQYSLLGYVGQIGILQVLRLAIPRHRTPSWFDFIALPAAGLLTVLLVELTHWARSKATLADRAYRLVFV